MGHLLPQNMGAPTGGSNRDHCPSEVGYMGVPCNFRGEFRIALALLCECKHFWDLKTSVYGGLRKRIDSEWPNGLLSKVGLLVRVHHTGGTCGQRAPTSC